VIDFRWNARYIIIRQIGIKLLLLKSLLSNNIHNKVIMMMGICWEKYILFILKSLCVAIKIYDISPLRKSYTIYWDYKSVVFFFIEKPFTSLYLVFLAKVKVRMFSLVSFFSVQESMVYTVLKQIVGASLPLRKRSQLFVLYIKNDVETTTKS
jgi:hypothetical protein